jgi:hypothetical protein
VLFLGLFLRRRVMAISILLHISVWHLFFLLIGCLSDAAESSRRRSFPRKLVLIDREMCLPPPSTQISDGFQPIVSRRRIE